MQPIDADDSAPWQSLCLRTVDVCFNPDDRPASNACTDKYWSFHEEGFLSTSIVTSPRPFVGRARQVPNEPGSFMLGVLDRKNQVQFECHCRPDPEQFEFTRIPIGGNFRPHLTWDDFQSSDRVIVTATSQHDFQPPTKDRPACLHYAELLVYPVFFSDAPLTLIDEETSRSGLWLVNARNWPDGSRMPGPRDGEWFPVLIAAHATRFVPAEPDRHPNQRPDRDRKDKQIIYQLPTSDEQSPDGVRFTVEGERRFYAAPWLQTDAGAADASFYRVRTMTAIDYVDSLPDSERSKALILNPFGPAEVLSYRHLRPADLLNVLEVPQPRSDVDDAITTQQVELGKEKASSLRLGWLPSGADPRPKPGEDSAGAAEAGAAEAPLKLLRGFVEGVECELVYSVKDSTPLATSFPLDKPQFTDLPTAGKGSLRVRGSFMAKDGKNGIAPVDSAKLSVQELEGDVTTRRITWFISVRPLDGSAARVVSYFDRAATDELSSAGTYQLDENGSPADNWNMLFDASEKLRFVHPLKCIADDGKGNITQSSFVEIVATETRAGLVGRAWPQHALGRYAIDIGQPTLHLIDGTSTAVEAVAALQAGATRRFRLTKTTVENHVRQTAEVIEQEPDHVTVAGEVTSVSVSDDCKLSIHVTDLFGKDWVTEQPFDRQLPDLVQTWKSTPVRRLRDLELGEFLIARCDLQTAGARLVQIQHFDERGPKLLKAAVCLVGTLRASATRLGAGATTSEGSNQFHPNPFEPIVKFTDPTRGGGPSVALEIWCDGTAAAFFDQLVVGPALRAIYAETITEIAGNAAEVTEQGAFDAFSRPVHATVSGMLASWSGWSLTVKPPGRSDAEPQDTHCKPISPLTITSRRPTKQELCELTPMKKWLLPKLRYEQKYRICLRRVDLAGNHEFDQSIFDADRYTSAVRKASNVLRTLYIDALYAKASERAGRATAETIDCDGLPFQPVHIPPAALLAFATDRPTPEYQAGTQASASSPPALVPATPAGSGRPRRPAPTASHVPLNQGQQCAPNVPCSGGVPGDVHLQSLSDYRAVAFARPGELFLLSEVFGGDNSTSAVVPPAMRDAYAQLLPPPWPVEQVILSGKLDPPSARRAGEATRVVNSIRKHERYLDLHCNFFGMLRDGSLNYFGDFYADEFRFGVWSRDCASAETTLWEEDCPVRFFDNRWPQPRMVHLYLRSLSRPPRLDFAGPRLLKPVVDNTTDYTRVGLRLPPGTQGEMRLKLQLSFKGKVEGTGYSGKGEGVDNPDKEDVPNVGPIPRGEWSIGDPYDDKKKGPVVLPLKPVGHDAHKRTGFLIHGDNKEMNKTASNGCIILSKVLRERIAKSGVKKLVVER